MTSEMSVLVTPRDGPPYLDLLYGGVSAAGVRVHYAEGPTGSHTLNLALAPAGLIWNRIHGFRVLHVHWVFQFSLPWARGAPWSRHLMEWWFRFYLRIARICGYRIVWTAHDLLPHEQVFASDRRARDFLLSKTSAVIALSESTASELRKLGARDVSVIPMGSYASPYKVTGSREESRDSFGFKEDDVVVALIGKMEKYKGADLLISSAARLPILSKISILLAGSCSDEKYMRELNQLAKSAGERVEIDFRWIPDQDLARYLQAIDFAAFPFREITNSGSVLLALSFGKPVIIPMLVELEDIPSGAAIRFGSKPESLTDALLRAENLSEDEYEEMSAVALAWASRADWTDIAKDTIDVYRVAGRQ